MRERVSITRLYKRFSQITGIPLRDLLPVHTNEKLSFTQAARYAPLDHSISFRRGTKNLRHELGHSLQSLASSRHDIRASRKAIELAGQMTESELEKMDPKRRKIIKNAFERIFRRESRPERKGRLDMPWTEPTNIDFQTGKTLKVINDFRPRWPLFLTTATFGFNQIFTAAMMGFIIRRSYLILKRNKNMQDLYKQHGNDGVLLLWVAPPKTMDALSIPDWENKMVSAGFLQPNGGLTKQGLHYWRENLQPQQVRKHLADAHLSRTIGKVSGKVVGRIRRPRIAKRK